MPREENFTFRPDFSKAGSKENEGEGALFTWFSPPDEGGGRFRYAVIKEEDGVLSIQPDEGRFKKGLEAWRWVSEEGDGHTAWVVTKVRPNRVDLRPVAD